MTPVTPSAGPLHGPTPDPSPRNARLREAAVGLEASFLKEMLSAAGLGRVPGVGGGGPGEEQFSSFLLDAQARRIAEGGGIGLASAIMAAMEGQGG